MPKVEKTNYANLDYDSITDVVTLREAITFWKEKAVQSEYKSQIISLALESTCINNFEKVRTIIRLMKD